MNLHAERKPAEGRRSIEAASVAERHARLAGIALYCCALLCFSGTDTSAKWLSRSLPVLEIVWARYFISAAFVFVVANPWTDPGIFRTKRPGLQAFRSALLLGSTAGSFLALRSLQLAESTSIGFSQPLLIALFAGPLLGEWVGPRRLAAICVGFLGVLVVTRPGHGALQPAVLYALAGVTCNSFYYIVTRKLAAIDPPRTTMVYTGLAGIVALTPMLPWIWVAPATPGHWGLMLTMGFFGAVSQWLIILAHHRAPAAVLAPFSYIQIIWTTALGFLIFGDIPALSTFVGGAIVIGSGLYLWYRERARRAEG